VPVMLRYAIGAAFGMLIALTVLVLAAAAVR
jgi:hypothetical protein